MTPAKAMAELMTSGLSLEPPAVSAALAHAWPLLYGPLRYYETERLIALFRHAGYVTDGPARPDSDLTVYRGELAGSANTGISWTTDQAVATKFARNYTTAGQTHVLQATATPESVLARFILEDEVVIEPDLLVAVTSLGCFPHFTRPPAS
jgi:hypothetical protein